MKLYLKAVANPFTIGFTLFMMIGMSLAFVIDPESVGSKDYMVMICAIQMGKFGVVLTVMMGNIKLHQNKFYAASSCAKYLFTVAPLTFGFTVSLIYDILLNVFAAVNFGITGLADVLVMNSIGSALLIFIAACYGKKKLTLWYAIPYMLFITAPVIGRTGILYGMTGLSIGASAAIAASIYIGSSALLLLLVNVWWKKSDKCTMPNKYMMNLMGEQ